MHEKRQFLLYQKRRHDAQITWPYAYCVTLGVAAKWSTRAPKTKLIFCPRDPQGYSRFSLSLPGRIFKERVPVFHGFCEIALTEVLATQMGVMRRSNLKSDRLNCINLIHFRLTAGRLRGNSCIVIPGVVCAVTNVHTRGAVCAYT